MPTYQYRCTECGNDLEAVQKFSDPSLTECPVCSGRLRKVFNAVGVVFKGSGFYRTDSRKQSSSGDEPGTSGSSDKSGVKSGSEGSSTTSSESSGSGSSGSGTSGSGASESSSSSKAPVKAASTGSSSAG